MNIITMFSAAALSSLVTYGLHHWFDEMRQRQLWKEEHEKYLHLNVVDRFRAKMWAGYKRVFLWRYDSSGDGNVTLSEFEAYLSRSYFSSLKPSGGLLPVNDNLVVTDEDPVNWGSKQRFKSWEDVGVEEDGKVTADEYVRHKVRKYRTYREEKEEMAPDSNAKSRNPISK